MYKKKSKNFLQVQLQSCFLTAMLAILSRNSNGREARQKNGGARVQVRVRRFRE